MNTTRKPSTPLPWPCHYQRGIFYVIERTLSDGSKVYDVCTRGEARAVEVTIENSYDGRRALDLCDALDGAMRNAYPQLVAALRDAARAIEHEVSQADAMDHPVIRAHSKIADRARSLLAELGE